MGFDDLFADVSFGDAKIPLGGTPAPQDAGNPGTPAPGADKGQPAGSPPATADQKAGTSDKQGAQSDKPPEPKPDGDKPAGDKPAPYDQDPKWKKARAAEKALDDLLQEHGLLDVEELKAKLQSEAELKKQLGTRDPKKLLDDAEYADRVRKNWEAQKRAEQLKDETPDVTIQRLERENAELKKTHDEFKNSVEDKEHARRVVQTYNTEINKVLGTLETPLPDAERELATLVLGVENPVNLIDIEDVPTVRKTARESLTKFQTVMQTIKQNTIDEYVAGKSKLAVDTNKGAPASPGQGVQRQPIPKDATVDDVFDATNAEFIELLKKGAAALT
jgi:hypothetical protein